MLEEILISFAYSSKRIYLLLTETLAFTSPSKGIQSASAITTSWIRYSYADKNVRTCIKNEVKKHSRCSSL